MVKQAGTFDEVVSDGGDSLVGEVILRCEGLHARHNDELLLSDVDFEVRAGEVVSIVVESEWCAQLISRIAIGINEPGGGEVELLGVRLKELTEREELTLRNKVGYLFHNSGLIHNLTVWYNVALPALYHSRFADLQGVAGRVEQLIDRCNLREVSQIRPAELGEATRKRVALARAWVMSPPLLVFEDPLMDIDTGSGSELLDLALGETPEEWEGRDPRPHNPGVLITSQELHEGLFRYVDRLIIIQEGRIVFSECPRDFDRRGKIHPGDLLEKKEAF
jgi:putative ABC transport system ATP-binding protein